MLKKIMLTYIVLVCCYLYVPSAASDVLVLTDNDFSVKIKEQETILIMFYAPWCGHCKKLKPEFEKAASILTDNDPPVKLAKIDCTEAGKATCDKHSISGYPTLKIFKDGEFLKEYNGPLKTAGIVKYMKKQVGPSAKPLTSFEQLQNFLNEPHLGVVGFFKNETPLKDIFINVADKLREIFRFALISNEEIIKKYNLQEEGIILFRPQHLQNKFEPSQLIYEGSLEIDDLESWYKTNQHGLVGHREKATENDFKKPLVVAYYNVDYIKNPKGTNYWRNRVLKVAQNYASDFTFAISSENDFQSELNDFGYDYSYTDKPVVFARSVENKKFVMEDEFSVENFEKFLKNIKSGDLKPYLKSEPIPEFNDNPVKVAVAKNFDEIVTNNGVDTFIEFYSPWCGHCKKLAPIWEELGEKMANEDVEIVKMDAANNDVPLPYAVQRYPTIYWAAKNSKDTPFIYSGGRKLKDFISYISDQATDELKGYDREGNTKPKDEL